MKQGRWTVPPVPPSLGPFSRGTRMLLEPLVLQQCCPRHQSTIRGEGRAHFSLKSAILQLTLQTIL